MPTFIGAPVTVEQAAGGPEPVRFVWQDRTLEVREILQAWSDWNFGAGTHTRSWRNRRHRNYYRVQTDEGRFELYADRGIRGEIRKWILVQQLEDLPVTDSALPDLHSLWDFGDPKATEARFRQLLPRAKAARDTAYENELLTQLARTLGLQQQFDLAHELLDGVERSGMDAGPRVRVRYLLERGRVWNSSGSREKAVPLFEEAWELACEHELPGLAVDAAHMVAIAQPGSSLEWNLRALELAVNSQDPVARAWRGSLYNNLGWTCFDRQEYSSALSYFKEALVCRQEQGKSEDIRVARWCVAKCLRFLGDVKTSLAEQVRLEEERQSADSPDGFVHEEIAECLLALNRSDEARPHFARAYELLAADPWLARDEPARLARLLEQSRS